MVNTLCCSTDNCGEILGKGAEKGNFNFLAAFQSFGWHFKPYRSSLPRALATRVYHRKKSTTENKDNINFFTLNTFLLYTGTINSCFT